jgi:hypothetical protein
MVIRSKAGRAVKVSDRLGRALVRSGRFVEADEDAEMPAPKPKKKPRKKGDYKRRDMRPEE